VYPVPFPSAYAAVDFSLFSLFYLTRVAAAAESYLSLMEEET
jgi:hypothetical protein